MRKTIATLFFTLLITACSRPAADNETVRLYQTLDSLIERHDDIVAAKETQIRTFTEGLRGVTLTPEQEYDLNLRLYDEYLAFRFDSAYHYIHRNMISPLAADSPDRHAASAIRMAHILSVSGIFNNARLLLDSIQPRQLSTETRVAYYNQRAELNLYRSEMAQYTPYFMDYIDSAQYYRQLLIGIAPKESFEYKANNASYTCEKGDVKGAISQSSISPPCCLETASIASSPAPLLTSIGRTASLSSRSTICCSLPSATCEELSWRTTPCASWQPCSWSEESMSGPIDTSHGPATMHSNMAAVCAACRWHDSLHTSQRPMMPSVNARSTAPTCCLSSFHSLPCCWDALSSSTSGY